MYVTTKTSHFSYCLLDSIEMEERDDAVIVTSPSLCMAIPLPSPDLRQVLLTLTRGRCSVCWLNEAIIHTQGEEALILFYRSISNLLRHQILGICAGNQERVPLATLIPISPAFHPRWAQIQDTQKYRMSRFAYTRRSDDGSMSMESPLAHVRLQIEDAITAKIIYHLGEATTARSLTEMLPEADADDVTSVLALLLMGNFTVPIINEDQVEEEKDEALMQWEFHDLLFHSRSRHGRHSNIMGGTYRFEQILAPLPAIKPPQWPITLHLPRPDMDQIRRTDPSLIEVMETRTSQRTYGTNAITIDQLGEFLYRVARIKAHQKREEGSDVTTRPYPSAGASYEIEFYLTIDRCQGLMPGFYWYDPMQHALALVHTMDKESGRMLTEAQRATGESNPPQLVITLAARFQRISWKYQGIAYQLILKDVGVLFAMMYLVATAMKLAPCALGLGDSDYFAHLTGTNYLQETSVGEFALGSQPDEIV